MLLKYGYFAQDVRWYEKPYDVPCELNATFLQNGTTYVVSLHRKQEFAQRYAAALQDDPAVRQATQAGTHLVRVVEQEGAPRARRARRNPGSAGDLGEDGRLVPAGEDRRQPGPGPAPLRSRISGRRR